MKIQNSFASLLTVACLLGFVGCKQETASTTPTPTAATEDHGHEHTKGDEQDHSVAGHGHGAGPHDGTIADWGGGKYHVEFTVDHDKTQATAYVLGGDEKTPAPIAAKTIELNIVDPEMMVTLNASPDESDPDGKASRFIGTHEKLGVVQEYEGSMTGVIDGTPYTGEFKEETHDHE
ncbi:hypothetical protein LOC71_09600 [Rhodopirellula sp. JC740]|uniref:Uncharacterized protein n=1 Tax=Rhodopirellula halodulae TaxID=2894198 RepID=A0ABS8NG57_9BACT|nr:hypothetical protein [Rhodopirellula sp. JC740]MCC9642529.1 hypothetical protein [Rhodopirellula sp. JC740]